MIKPMKNTSHDHPGILSFLIIKKGKLEFQNTLRGVKYIEKKRLRARHQNGFILFFFERQTN